jgi:hypothetical protein
MRQWACVVALLLGLAGNGYAATVRIRLPIAIERRLDTDPDGADDLEILTEAGGLRRTLDWWRA